MENQLPTVLQIPYIVDTQKPELEFIPAHIVSNYFELHELTDIRTNEKNRFLCYRCKEPITLYSRAIRNGYEADSVNYLSGHKYHPQHKAGYGNNCKWKTGSSTKGEVYKGVQEGMRHAELKTLLAETLLALPNWELVGTIEEMDRYYLIHPDKRRGKPDVHARYRGREVVFEIQLRSESPETILKRKSLYKDLGKQLIWLSIENSQIVSASYEFDAIEVKQVQKDIAFSNRGNWFLFDENIAEASLKSGKLELNVMYWHPELIDRDIFYDWKQAYIDFSQLKYSEGETFYKDFHALDSEFKNTLRDTGKQRVLEALPINKPHQFSDFYMMAKDLWPSFDREVDSLWLSESFEVYHQERVVLFKKLIVEFFKSADWRDKGKIQRWKDLGRSVIDMDFGFFEEMEMFHLQVIEKIILILGYELSPYLNVKRKSHKQATHYFFDAEFCRFIVYRDLCMKAINSSYLSDDILADPKIIERLHRNADKPTQVHVLDRFLEWFVQEPVFNP